MKTNRRIYLADEARGKKRSECVGQVGPEASGNAPVGLGLVPPRSEIRNPRGASGPCP